MSAARLLDAAHMTADEMRRLAAPILSAHPLLTVNGWPGGREPTSRDFDYQQVLTAALFLLALARRRRTFNRKAYSYRLKHNAENWGAQNGLSTYVSNGAFILAALICGYEFRTRPGSLNCMFNMAVDADMRRYDWPAR